MEPRVELSRSYRYSQKELKALETIVEEHRDELISAWRAYFLS